MKTTTRMAALAASGVLAVTGVAACSSSSSGGGSTSGSAKPAAQVNNLTGEHTQVTFDSGFVQALQSLKVTPAPLGSASISKAGVATFPITGGNVTYYKPGTRNPYVVGKIDHNGSGLSLTAGGKTVKLENFVVNPGTSQLMGKVVAGGKTVGNDVYLFFLNGKTLQPLATGPNNTAILQGTKVYLSPAAASTLNKFFGISALSGKTLVGVAKITINT